jgi:hypothetical protein
MYERSADEIFKYQYSIPGDDTTDTYFIAVQGYLLNENGSKVMGKEAVTYQQIQFII